MHKRTSIETKKHTQTYKGILIQFTIFINKKVLNISDRANIFKLLLRKRKVSAA